VRFSVGGFEYFEIARQENPNEQSVLDWYLSRNPAVSPSQVQQFFTKSGLEGVRTIDGMTAYVALNGSVYRLAHVQVYGTGGEASGPTGPWPDEFRATFTMFVNSFSRKP
jgi:hypothetical protein